MEEADAVIIGAGAGLSTSAGFVYTGERFEKHFHDFAEKYHFSDMYSGGFYPFDTLEEYWVYWSRYIWINRYTPAPKPVYEDLLGLVKNKDYFVLTTNVDHQFQTRDSISIGCSIRKVIMACFSVTSRVARKPMITKPPFVRWWSSRKVCVCRQNWFRIARSVASQ